MIFEKQAPPIFSNVCPQPEGGWSEGLGHHEAGEDFRIYVGGEPLVVRNKAHDVVGLLVVCKWCGCVFAVEKR